MQITWYLAIWESVLCLSLEFTSYQLFKVFIDNSHKVNKLRCSVSSWFLGLLSYTFPHAVFLQPCAFSVFWWPNSLPVEEWMAFLYFISIRSSFLNIGPIGIFLLPIWMAIYFTWFEFFLSKHGFTPFFLILNHICSFTFTKVCFQHLWLQLSHLRQPCSRVFHHNFGMCVNTG